MLAHWSYILKVVNKPFCVWFVSLQLWVHQGWVSSGHPSTIHWPTLASYGEQSGTGSLRAKHTTNKHTSEKGKRLTHDPDIDDVGCVLPLEIVGGAGVVAGVLPSDALKYKVLAFGQDSNPGLRSCLHTYSLETKEMGLSIVRLISQAQNDKYGFDLINFN